MVFVVVASFITVSFFVKIINYSKLLHRVLKTCKNPTYIYKFTYSLKENYFVTIGRNTLIKQPMNII